MVKEEKDKHEKIIELIILIAGVIIIIGCLFAAWNLHQTALLKDKVIDPQSLTIFISIATLISGYIFGRFGGSKK